MTGTADASSDAGVAGPPVSVPADALDVDPPATAPRLSVAGFDGPLDALLEMARARKIDLATLSIAALIDAFNTALQTALANRAGVRLEHWAGWTVTAATLTELWSRLMLPADSPEAKGAVAEAEALREQIASRTRMQAGADWLEQRLQLGQDVFRRGRPEVAAVRRGGDLTALLRACLVVLTVPEEQAIALSPRRLPFWTASDAIRRISGRLPELADAVSLAAFLPDIEPDAPHWVLRRRVALASTLVAGLELARTGALALDQDADWMPIQVTRREAGEPVPDDFASSA